MSSYLNYNFYNGGSPEPNVVDLNLTNKLINYFKNIKIGTITKNYTIPNTIGLPNQVLSVDTSGTNLFLYRFWPSRHSLSTTSL